MKLPDDKENMDLERRIEEIEKTLFYIKEYLKNTDEVLNLINEKIEIHHKVLIKNTFNTNEEKSNASRIN